MHPQDLVKRMVSSRWRDLCGQRTSSAGSKPITSVDGGLTRGNKLEVFVSQMNFAGAGGRESKKHLVEQCGLVEATKGRARVKGVLNFET